MAFRVRRRGKINAIRIGMKVAMTVIGLWVAGVVLDAIGSVMNCTQSAFFNGLSLIGWTVESVVSNGSTFTGSCSDMAYIQVAATHNNVVTSTTGSGILAVVGIIALASIVTEFVQFSM